MTKSNINYSKQITSSLGSNSLVVLFFTIMFIFSSAAANAQSTDSYSIAEDCSYTTAPVELLTGSTTVTSEGTVVKFTLLAGKPHLIDLSADTELSFTIFGVTHTGDIHRIEITPDRSMVLALTVHSNNQEIVKLDYWLGVVGVTVK